MFGITVLGTVMVGMAVTGGRGSGDDSKGPLLIFRITSPCLWGHSLQADLCSSFGAVVGRFFVDTRRFRFMLLWQVMSQQLDIAWYLNDSFRTLLFHHVCNVHMVRRFFGAHQAPSTAGQGGGTLVPVLPPKEAEEEKEAKAAEKEAGKAILDWPQKGPKQQQKEPKDVASKPANG